MNTVRLIVKELLGLFVDDGSLALAILALIAILAGLFLAGLMSPFLGGVLLALGCAAILVENVLRAAGRSS